LAASRAGVCIVRVETQPNLVLITVTEDRHLDKPFAPVVASVTRRFTTADEAVRAVSEFLDSFLHSTPPPTGQSRRP
jgi:hypothetical protein